MSWSHAFFCVLFFVGICSAAYLIGDFLRFHHRHRNIRLSRPQPDSRDWLGEFKRTLR